MGVTVKVCTKCYGNIEDGVTKFGIEGRDLSQTMIREEMLKNEERSLVNVKGREVSLPTEEV